MIATSIASLLALAPPSPTERGAFDVDTVQVEHGADSLNVLVYDPGGEVTAEIVVWRDSADQIHVDANFADDLFLSALVNDAGEVIEIESDDGVEAIGRIDRVRARLSDDPQASTELLCLGSVIVAGTSCLTGNVPGCMLGGIGITCQCLPLLGDYPPGCG